MHKSNKLDAKAFGLALGFLWALAMLLLGLADIYTNWADAFGMVMSTVYPGYAPTVIGSVVGAFWGFIDAFVGGLVFAWIYNALAK